MILRDFKSINYYYLALSIFTLIGLYARFKGISIWPLADDEYHTVESVRKILKHGLPFFDCDGLYSRGILYQYFLATLNIIFGNNEVLVYRSANAIISLFALPAIYLIARKFISREGAIICLMVYLTSVWEVEYARYIRMYMPFQVIFLWYIYYLLEATTNNNLNKLKHVLALSALSILVYEEGIFLTVINFLVLILAFRANYKNTKLLAYFSTAVIIFIFAFFYLRIDFRHILIDNYLPQATGELSQSINAKSHGPIQIPHLLVTHLLNFPYWAVAGIAIFVSSVAAFLWVNNRYRSPLLLLLSFLILLFSVFNVFTLVLLTIITFYFLSWLNFDKPVRPIILYTIFVVSIFSVYWILVVLNTDILLYLHGYDATINFKKALVALFKYPNYYDQVINPWLSGQPLITLIMGTVISAGIAIDYFHKRESSLFVNHSLLVILLVCTLVAITVQPYHNTRYTFLIYPLLIILTIYYLSSIISRLNFNKYSKPALLIASLSLMFVSDDHDLHHLLNIDTHAINFRTDMSSGRRFHLRNKMDFRSPAEHINADIQTTDIVITSVRPVHHYLDKLDYYYITPEDSEFINVAACENTKELWTNTELISSDDMLLEIISNSRSRVWLILKSGEFPFPNSAEKRFYTEYKDNISFSSTDANIAVYKFDPAQDVINKRIE